MKNLPKFPLGDLTKEWNEIVSAKLEKKTAGFQYIAISIIFFCLFCSSLIFSLRSSNIINVVIFSILTGLFASIFSINTMHDSGHGSVSNNRTLNSIIFWLSTDLFCASSRIWNIKHNVIHHTFTNVNKIDEDIDLEPLMRLSPDQKWKSHHRFQVYYALPLYCFTLISWYFRDFKNFYNSKAGGREISKASFFEWFIFILGKVISAFWIVILPILSHGFILGIVSSFITFASIGIYVAVIFQMAHVVENVEMINSSDEMKEFVVHQAKTTSDFAPESFLTSVLTGGLNTQVIHHVSPTISSSRLRTLVPEFSKFCEAKGIKYRSFPSFSAAFLSHLSHLKKMGDNVVI